MGEGGRKGKEEGNTERDREEAGQEDVKQGMDGGRRRKEGIREDEEARMKKQTEVK